MTRKDYIAIAAVIANNRDGFSDNKLLLDELVKDLCEVFECDNPRFDIIRFMKASRGVNS